MIEKGILVEGADAYRKGKTVDDNPYDAEREREKFATWLNGFLDEEYYNEFELQYFDYER